jgi:hypothetical protein
MSEESSEHDREVTDYIMQLKQDRRHEDEK